MAYPSCKNLLLALLCALVSVQANTAPISGQGTWEATLQGRDLDGNASTYEAYYDTTLDITWLADANAAGTIMNWADANTWATGLNIAGVIGWRLPTLSPVNGSVFNTTQVFDGSTDRGHNLSRPGTLHGGTTASELAHLFYNTLGNVSNYDVLGVRDDSCAGSCFVNNGPFTNTDWIYWTNMGPPPGYKPNSAWAFHTYHGYQSVYISDSDYYAWAVHDGDVGAVPLPAAAWLFLSALGGLGIIKRRKR